MSDSQNNLFFKDIFIAVNLFFIATIISFSVYLSLIFLTDFLQDLPIVRIINRIFKQLKCKKYLSGST